MKKILILTFLFPIFGQMDYIFSDNVQVTHFSNDQKFPEMIIHNDILHLTWVSVYGSNKNIMYAQSDDFGQTYTEPIQINYLNNNIVAYGQSGSKIEAYNDNIYITYMDDRTGSWAIYLSKSDDNGITWDEEILISDTPYLNGYQDFEIDLDGNLHIIYYNFAANNHLADVRYRFAVSGSINFSPSQPVGLVTDAMEPCDCCQPDLEISQDGDIYIAYRNNIQNYRDTFLSIKRFGDNGFNEGYQVSYFQDHIPYCPSSGPDMDIGDDNIAIAYTVYANDNVYTSVSNLDNIDFSLSDPINAYPDGPGKQNYPFIITEEELLVVWANYINNNNGNWDIYFGMRNLELDTMSNIQKINDDETNFVQKDPVIYKHENNLYIFWSDDRESNTEIYFCKGVGQSDLLGDVNQDFIINVLDVIELIQIILGHSDNIDNADMNDDDIINIQDVILLVNIILNN